jgi:hypothetical protein
MQQQQVSTPTIELVQEGDVRAVPGIGEVNRSGATSRDTSKIQMLAGMSLAQAAQGICCWTEKEAENTSRDWPRFDLKILGYAAWKKA